MRKLFFTTLTLLTLSIPFGCQKETTDQLAGDQTVTDRSAVTLPAGSHNALQEALDNNTTVILAPGIHTEDASVIVTGKRHIVGQPGAVLRMSTETTQDFSVPISVALHFNNAAGSSIRGVRIEPTEDIGGAAILLENSANAVVDQCNIVNFQYGIYVEQSPSVKISKNTLPMSTGWLTGDIPEALGIVIINGAGAVVEDNEVSGAIFGIWPCDKDGVLRRNKTYDNYIGVILCKFPEGGNVSPSGAPLGAQFPCTNWAVRNNNSYNNWDAGYLVIDGANHNLLDNNSAANNGTYDYDLVGDSYRFGFLTPTSHHNTVKAGTGQTVKDCGLENTVTGGILIDNNLFPCF